MSGEPGRPRHYNSPEEFDAMVDMYVATCESDGEYLTYTGLALFLGFHSRNSIDTYRQYDGFSNSVDRAKAIVEQSYEKHLYKNGSSGAQFALKNYGWSDRRDVAHTSPDGSMSPKSDVDLSQLSDAALAELMAARVKAE